MPSLSFSSFLASHNLCYDAIYSFRWYLVCDLQTRGCFKYYHPECIGLTDILSEEHGQDYSNCPDGKSFICPHCEQALKKVLEETYGVLQIYISN